MNNAAAIRRVAILGAGVMGAQIAAHLANAEVPVMLFDLSARDGDPNGIVNKAIANLAVLNPAPLATRERAMLIKPANYDQHLEQLRDCDVLIEAIAERLDWKADLYQRITPYLNGRAILASNTSGLPINLLAESLPESLRPRFCGLHFFNPPRYMALAELIPCQVTAPDILDRLETFLVSALGKGVIRAKDTPNFIANRIGLFGGDHSSHPGFWVESGFGGCADRPSHWPRQKRHLSHCRYCRAGHDGSCVHRFGAGAATRPVAGLLCAAALVKQVDRKRRIGAENRRGDLRQ